MKRTVLLLLLFLILFSGCASQKPAVPPTETSIPIKELVAEALLATQKAEDKIPPSFPYSPAQLATLLEPGKDLEGRWTPSTVTDITRPIPGYACSGYYGSCWGDWAKDISYGAELQLLLKGDKLGQIDFMYFDDLAEVENAYQLWFSKWSDREENIHPYAREPIGEQWLSRARYVEIDENEGTDQDPVWMDHLCVEIAFSRCHGYVTLRIYFPAQTPSSSPDDLSPERIEEKEALFDLAYEYIKSVDERITPYACNP